jgi:hypothetical protein
MLITAKTPNVPDDPKLEIMRGNTNEMSVLTVQSAKLVSAEMFLFT